MPKRNVTSKKRTRKTVHFSESDKILIQLQDIASKGQKDASAANSLKMWYLEHKSWTTKQWAYARALAARSKDKTAKKLAKSRKLYLYAITDGTAVKLGYSSDINKRIKAMQTGHPAHLKAIWKYYTGTNEAQAQNLEKKLHRCCKTHRIRGEWFRLGAMNIVEQFKIKHSASRDRCIEEQEFEIVAAAQERI